MTHERTPYRPPTKGKVGRFHRVLLKEWAHIRDWTSGDQSHHGYPWFLHLQ